MKRICSNVYNDTKLKVAMLEVLQKCITGICCTSNKQLCCS